MSIKISEFKNVYGIRNLKGVSDINENSIIYAPNGGTKTSLALGLKRISNGIMPNDRIFGNSCEYKFQIGDKLYTNKTAEQINNIVVYNFDEYCKTSLEDKNHNIDLLTISTDLRKKYGDVYSDTLLEIKKISISISNMIGEKKKEADNLEFTLNFFKTNFKLNNWKDIIVYLSKLNWEEQITTSYKISNILNENTIPIISEENFVESVQKLNNTINSKIESVLFKNNFGSLEAQKLLKELSSDGFFDAGHSIKLFGTDELIKTAKEFENKYNEQLELIYQDDDTKKTVEDLLSKINKNKATREIRTLIADPLVLTQMGDIKTFSNKILSGLLQNLKFDIENGVKVINNSEIKINELMTESEKQKTEWDKICDIFNNRFDVPFKINIKDKFNSMVGISYPTFQIEYISGSDIKVIEESLLKETLSTGELRALTTLYFLFDLNTSITQNEETFVILDDIADSFDYKNKYAMIEYISEISKQKIVCWILTHNFDFFNSCKYRTRGFKKFYIKKNNDSENFLKFNESIIGGGMELFNNWKSFLLSNNDEKKLLALIPVARNIIELKNGVESEEYKTLCKILHYRKETKTILVKDIKPIFLSVFGFELNFDPNKLVIDILNSNLDKIASENLSNKVDLDDKLILAIGIRINMEIIFNKYDATLMENEFLLGEEYEKVKKFISNEEEIATYNKALISIPEFIHLNSFMYEPLVDIQSTVLQKIYKDICLIKKKYNL